MGFVTIFGPVSEVNTYQVYTLGSRASDKDGKEYIYLSGASSMVKGDWVSYGSTFAATRMTGAIDSPVAVSMGTTNATTSYGWFQRYGLCTQAKLANTTASTRLFYSGTTAVASAAGGSAMSGALATDTYGALTYVGACWLDYPTIGR